MLTGSIHKFTDEEIVILIREGQEQAHFTILYDRYYKKVLDKCYSMTKSKTMAEDLTQDIMVKAMEKLNQFMGKSSFSTWIYAITYNHCIEYLRNHKRIKFEDWSEMLDLPEETTDEDIEQVLELKEERLALLLELLKPEDKAIILLKYDEGFSIKNIMPILNLESESAAKMRLNRAKKRLIALYKRFYPVIES